MLFLDLCYNGVVLEVFMALEEQKDLTFNAGLLWTMQLTLPKLYSL